MGEGRIRPTEMLAVYEKKHSVNVEIINAVACARIDQAAKERELAQAMINKIFASRSWRIAAKIQRIANSLRELWNKLPRN